MSTLPWYPGVYCRGDDWDIAVPVGVAACSDQRWRLSNNTPWRGIITSSILHRLKEICHLKRSRILTNIWRFPNSPSIDIPVLVLSIVTILFSLPS